MATRRGVLRQLAVGIGVLATRGVTAQPAEAATYVGIETAANGISRARFFAMSGAMLGTTALDFRAHGMAEYQGRLAVFPRRPGDRFAVVNTASLEIHSVTIAPEGRHFFGHGAFSQDGATLVVPENDLDTLQGAVAIYDMTGGQPRRLGRQTLPGPGPHEIVRMPGTDVFAIALGGLETHPAYGRTPLNLMTFRSQIVFYNVMTGALDPLGFWPGSEGVSLRHMAFDGARRLYIGGQIPGEAQGATVWMVEDEVPRPLPFDMGGYVSSVAASDGRALISSKVTGRVLEISGDQLITTTRLEGASAIAAKGRSRAMSGYTLLSLDGQGVASRSGHEFDNHGLMI